MTAPNGFHIEQVGDTFVPVLEYPNGGTFRCNPCACVDQAVHTATRGELRPLPFHGLRASVAVDLNTPCPVDRRHWSWRHHEFTHGALDRNNRRTA